MSIMYRYQWYIKLFVYKCLHRNEIDSNLEDCGTDYDIFISHEYYNELDRDWVFKVTDYIEPQQDDGKLGNQVQTRACTEENNCDVLAAQQESDETTALLSSNSHSTAAAPIEIFLTFKRWKIHSFEKKCGFGD